MPTAAEGALYGEHDGQLTFRRHSSTKRAHTKEGVHHAALRRRGEGCGARGEKCTQA